MAKFDIKTYAREGARARATELFSELQNIFRMFPDLKDEVGSGSQGARKRARRTTRRSVMTAAQRKAVSDRMRKYWAARRSKAAK